MYCWPISKFISNFATQLNQKKNIFCIRVLLCCNVKWKHTILSDVYIAFNQNSIATQVRDRKSNVATLIIQNKRNALYVGSLKSKSDEICLKFKVAPWRATKKIFLFEGRTNVSMLQWKQSTHCYWFAFYEITVSCVIDWYLIIMKGRKSEWQPCNYKGGLYCKLSLSCKGALISSEVFSKLKLWKVAHFVLSFWKCDMG